MTGRDIEKSICREMSGDLEQGMLAVGRRLGPALPPAHLGPGCTVRSPGAHHRPAVGQRSEHTDAKPCASVVGNPPAAQAAALYLPAALEVSGFYFKRHPGEGSSSVGTSGRAASCSPGGR